MSSHSVLPLCPECQEEDVEEYPEGSGTCWKCYEVKKWAEARRASQDDWIRFGNMSARIENCHWCGKHIGDSRYGTHGEFCSEKCSKENEADAFQAYASLQADHLQSEHDRGYDVDMSFDLDAFYEWLDERADVERENKNEQAAAAFDQVSEKLQEIMRFITGEAKPDGSLEQT